MHSMDVTRLLFTRHSVFTGVQVGINLVIIYGEPVHFILQLRVSV